MFLAQGVNYGGELVSTMKKLFENWRGYLVEQGDPGMEITTKSNYGEYKIDPKTGKKVPVMSDYTKFHASQNKLKKDFPWVHAPGDPGRLLTGVKAGESAKQFKDGMYYLRDVVPHAIASGKIPVSSLPKGFQQYWKVNILDQDSDYDRKFEYARNKIEVKKTEYFGDGLVTYYVLPSGVPETPGGFREYKMDAAELAKYEDLRPYAKNIQLWANSMRKMERDPKFK